jgi:hypothetical protein
MTRDEIMALPADELAALVAEKVMGWAVFRDGDVHDRPYVRDRAGLHVYPPAREHGNTWSPAEYASDDYMVLDHVRASWHRPRLYARMSELLSDEWSGRESWPNELQYRPGDYARAALIALEGA